jgi:hypothetical protein
VQSLLSLQLLAHVAWQ